MLFGIVFSIQQNIKSIKMRNAKSDKTEESKPGPFAQTYFHGTKADLKIGDLIKPGLISNYGQKKNANYIYLTATLDAAIWGAELARGERRERIYLVEPTGPIEDDPNLTNKKFPGNPTMSYRSKHPFKVVGEITIWQGHSDEQLRAMKEGLARLEELGMDAIED
jgi:rifampin ADP-ribosylating transferase